MITDREGYLNHRIPILQKMLRELVAERNELRRKREQDYLNRLEGCNPSRELTQ